MLMEEERCTNNYKMDNPGLRCDRETMVNAEYKISEMYAQHPIYSVL
jgi:hypothetical protein